MEMYPRNCEWMSDRSFFFSNLTCFKLFRRIHSPSSKRLTYPSMTTIFTYPILSEKIYPISHIIEHRPYRRPFIFKSDSSPLWNTTFPSRDFIRCPFVTSPFWRFFNMTIFKACYYRLRFATYPAVPAPSLADPERHTRTCVCHIPCNNRNNRTVASSPTSPYRIHNQTHFRTTDRARRRKNGLPPPRHEGRRDRGTHSCGSGALVHGEGGIFMTRQCA